VRSRLFQESDHLLALYAGESLEKLLDWIARFQMIEKTLHRNASSGKDRFPAKNFRVLRHDAAHDIQNTAWASQSQNRSSSALILSALNNLAAELWPLTSGSAYSTLTSLQRKRYLFVCINRRAEDNPKGCCAAKDSEEVYRMLKGEVAARGLAKVEARVCTSSCLDQCETGVTVLVEPDHFFYGRVTVADIPDIVDGLVTGQPVKRLVITADQL
jgi:(2Fe-2S) ferredoxin